MKQMGSQSLALPDFDDPPVVETLLDVAFTPLPEWRIPHFGLFWQLIKNDYPHVEDQPPISLQRERFGEEANKPHTFAFEFLQQPQARCWFISNAQSHLLQLQNDRFILNWRKIPSGEDYPHYDSIRPLFESEWNRFCEFLNGESLGIPEVQQCEIQYINHIELNSWQSFMTLVEPLAAWPGSRKGSLLPEPQDMAMTTTYLLPDNRGRMRITLQPAIRKVDGKSVIQLVLLARGQPKSSTTADILEWFDFGRDWLLKGFASFSTEKMHITWKRRD